MRLEHAWITVPAQAAIYERIPLSSSVQAKTSALLQSLARKRLDINTTAQVRTKIPNGLRQIRPVSAPLSLKFNRLFAESSLTSRRDPPLRSKPAAATHAHVAESDFPEREI